MRPRITQQKRSVRRRIWIPNRIFAGELERGDALETVKLTVVGDGRWTIKRPGIVMAGNHGDARIHWQSIAVRTRSKRCPVLREGQIGDRYRLA